MNYFLTSLLIFSYLAGQAQSLSGKVYDADLQPLIGASVRILGTEAGAVTNQNGEFSLKPVTHGDSLEISFIGFQTKRIAIQPGEIKQIILQEQPSQLGAVTVKASPSFLDMHSPAHKEVITEKELLKAACCNLSESFETNASVDVSFTDAVTGTKTIRMLGLDGRYTLINRENIPNIRGLSSRNGLTFIPGTWIQSIDVGKGAGTVLNGYESMTGQINLEFKNPDYGEKLLLNAYINSFGRSELNVNTSFKINEKWSGALLTHGSFMNQEIDRNKDGFMDLPKFRQINLLNRYQYHGDRIESQIGFHVLTDQKAGGELGFDFDDNASASQLYGYSNNFQKAELFGKVGLLYPNAPYKGWGFIYSGSIQDMQTGFGRRTYQGQEKTLYANLIHQNIIGSTFHQVKTGASLLVDKFEETFADSAFNRNEIVPGAFLEYSYLPSEKVTLLTAARIDYHNLYGLYYSPRWHFRYEMIEGGILRLSVGKGYRTANIIPDNNQVFVSSRELVVEDKLKPEESWNMGGSFNQEIQIGNETLRLTTDYFYTSFVNQVVVDLDSNPNEVRFHNLDGKSYAHSFQLEAGGSLNHFFSAKAAYKYYDVRTTLAGELRELPYISRHRGFFNLSYSSKYDIWKADATWQWYGRKRLPDTGDKPLEFQQPSYSPDFTNINAQISRAFRWGNVYLGVENLFDFRQTSPVIDANNPFGQNFDASIVWGPVAGRVIYLGARLTLD